MESIKSDVNVANVQLGWVGLGVTTGRASTLWKQTLRQLVSVAFCWDKNLTLSEVSEFTGRLAFRILGGHQ